MNKYIPSPLNLDDIELPEDIIALTELIAKNVHEVWAEQRIKEGWTYGEERDSVKNRNASLGACCFIQNGL